MSKCEVCGNELTFVQPIELDIQYCSYCVPYNENTEISEGTSSRNLISLRYDILVPEFLEAMARVAHVGAEKYGDYNWKKSRLKGDKGPINHIYKHLIHYVEEKDYDYSSVGTDKSSHLAAIAFNAMLEYWYCIKNIK